METKPYTYLIGWSKHNLWYYGVRVAKGCNPKDLWVTYFTSSSIVKKLISLLGEPDIKEIRKEFSDPYSAIKWENKVLSRLNLKDSKWINQCFTPLPYQLNSIKVFCVNGKIYKGLAAIVKEFNLKSNSAALARIKSKSPKWKNWNYYGEQKETLPYDRIKQSQKLLESVKSRVGKLRGPRPEHVKEKIRKGNKRFTYSVFEKEYNSIREISEDLKTPIGTVYERIHSTFPTWKDWKRL